MSVTSQVLEVSQSSSVFEPRDTQGQPNSVYPDGRFIFPSVFGLSYPPGSQLNASWSTVYENSNLWLSQYSSDSVATSITSSFTASWFNWEVAIPAGTTNFSDPFHFHITNANSDAEDQLLAGLWSVGFYIQGNQPSTSATNTPTPATATFSTGTSNSSSAQNTGTSPSTATSSPASTETLSSAAKAGIGVGATIGALLLLSLIAGFLYLAKRASKERHHVPSVSMSGQMPPRYDVKESIPLQDMYSNKEVLPPELSNPEPQEPPTSTYDRRA